MKLKIFVTLFTAFSLSGCIGGSSGGGGGTTAGPIDGNWTVTSLTCNGGANTIPGTLTIAISIGNATGTFTHTDTSAGTCVKTNPQTYTYPSSTTFTMQDGATSCNPANCAGMGDCSSTGNAEETWNYTVSGNTLSMNKVETGMGGNCANGETMAVTLTK